MHFIRITFKNTLAYRWNVFFSLLGSITVIAVNLLLWQFLYRDDPAMVSYMVKYVVLANFITLFYSQDMCWVLGDKVRDGSFATDLIKPVNIFFMSWQVVLGEMLSNFVVRGIPTILVYVGFLIANPGYHNIVWALLAVVLGHILYLLMYSLVGFATFVVIESWTFWRLLTETIKLFAGAFVPLAIMPGWLHSVAMALPFRFLFSFPLELLLGTADMSQLPANFLTMLLWIAAFSVFNILAYKGALRKTVIQGG